MMRSWLSLFHNVADLETRTRSGERCQDKTGAYHSRFQHNIFAYCIFKEQLTH
jgi:hypothetical protein